MYRALVLNARLGVQPGILADEPQWIDRLALAAELERDLGANLRRDAERSPGHQLLADLDIGPREPSDEAGPAVRVFDDDDASVAAIGPGEGDATRSRRPISCR